MKSLHYNDIRTCAKMTHSGKVVLAGESFHSAQCGGFACMKCLRFVYQVNGPQDVLSHCQVVKFFPKL